jgi:hypothetical protein
MRFVAALAGVLVSVPPLIFFWIGTQTFTRDVERALAYVMTIESAALLVLSIALFFTPSVQRIQLILLIITIGSFAAVLGANRRLK